MTTYRYLAGAAIIAVATMSSPGMAQTRTFDIAAQPANKGILAFAAQADVQISASGRDLRSRTVNTVNGTLDVAVALDRMLLNSGLRAVRVSPSKYVVRLAREGSTSQPTQRATPAPVAREPDATPPEADVGIQDIIVTATRREESLQNVPIAITAVTGEQLTSAGVSSTRGLEQVTPGLVIPQTAIAIQPTIRGVGTRGSSPGDESNVALYLDGVYQPAMSSNFFELLNIERVEVLKGPQGTLFGRNATGGAINVVTTKPSQETIARTTLRYGRYNDVKASTYIATPLSSTLSADLTAQYSYADGYVDDLVRGGKLGGHRGYLARGRLRWQPHSAADIILAVSHVDVSDASAFVTQPLDGNTRARRLNPTVLIPAKKREFAGNVRPQAGFDQTDVSLQGSFDLGAVSLQTTSDYQENSASFLSDSDGTTANLGFQQSPDLYTNAWSNEVRLISQGAGRFKWVVGALAFGSKAGLNPLLVSSGSAVTTIRGKQNTTAFAGFGEATYEIVNDLFLTGGLRYSWERKTFYPFVNVAQARARDSFDSWTPRGSVRYQFSNRASAYFTYSRGFKSGLFNAASAQRTAVRPEEVTSYEIGLKTEPARWLRANASAFIYDYSNLQVQARDITTASTTFQNAGDAKIKGVDLDIDIAPAKGLNLRVGAAYLHTRFGDFPRALITTPTIIGGIAVGGNDQLFQQVEGNDLIRSPKLTVTGGGSYGFDAAGGRIMLTGNVNYNDGYWLDVGNRLRQPAYFLINASVGWTTHDQALSVSLWGENLLAEDIVIYPIISGNGDLFSYRKPATYGVTVSTRF